MMTAIARVRGVLPSGFEGGDVFFRRRVEIDRSGRSDRRCMTGFPRVDVIADHAACIGRLFSRLGERHGNR